MIGKKYRMILDYEFKNLELLKEATTHTSYDKSFNYEKLEFLGDAVLNMLVIEMLIEFYPRSNEGDLAKRRNILVNKNAIYDVAGKINLAYNIKCGQGTRPNVNIVSDSMEAIIGAIYLDGGILEAKQFVRNLWGDMARSLTMAQHDAKTRLQEKSQGQGLGLPQYSFSMTGPSHEPVFEVTVRVGDCAAKSEGLTLKDAQQKAAEKLLQEKRWKN